MIKELKQFIEDFKDYRLIRRLNRTVVLNGNHKSMIKSYNKDFEKELDGLVLGKLAEEMIAGEISPEYFRGFRAALTWRISFLGLSNYKFPLNKD